MMRSSSTRWIAPIWLAIAMLGAGVLFGRTAAWLISPGDDFCQYGNAAYWDSELGWVLSSCDEKECSEPSQEMCVIREIEDEGQPTGCYYCVCPETPGTSPSECTVIVCDGSASCDGPCDAGHPYCKRQVPSPNWVYTCYCGSSPG